MQQERLNELCQLGRAAATITPSTPSTTTHRIGAKWSEAGKEERVSATWQPNVPSSFLARRTQTASSDLVPPCGRKCPRARPRRTRHPWQAWACSASCARSPSWQAGSASELCEATPSRIRTRGMQACATGKMNVCSTAALHVGTRVAPVAAGARRVLCSPCAGTC